ncbi:MAG: PIN domain-containing protein [Bacteroidia bacterium]|nr:PIN domain-containing protein [Bacteroidia bacterium]
MEAIIRTENKTLFDALLHFLRTLNITVEPMDKRTEIYISIVSLIEVFYITMQEQDKETAIERIALIKVLPMNIIGLDETEIETIGILKAKYQISFADSCIAGLAKSKNAELVHKDPEYEPLPVKQKKLPYKK